MHRTALGTNLWILIYDCNEETELCFEMEITEQLKTVKEVILNNQIIFNYLNIINTIISIALSGKYR